jgi:integral membrane protein (TIGR00529 family)
MPDLLKTAAVLILIIILLRRNVSMAAVMPIGALVLGLIYLTPPRDFLRAATLALFSPKSIEMTLTLLLTMVMEHILRSTGMLKRMVSSLSAALPDRRVVMAAMPAMIGMLPSPGGAVFSAPMVHEAAGEAPVTAEQKALINYWYRHIWEYVSPLYPGVILAAGITGLSTQTLFIANLPFALSVVAWGILFCFHGIARQPSPASEIRRSREFLTFLTMISPIMLALLLVVLLRISAPLALGGAVLSLYAVQRYTPAMILKNLRESVSGKALFLVIGIMIFQEVLRVTGALSGISNYFSSSQMPVHLLLFLIPFIAGVMTGLTVGFIGITFPLLLPLMGGAAPSPGLVALAFGSGFAGVMLSPVHLCYVLTCDYFKADIARVYHRLWLPSLCVLAAALVPLYLYR